MLAGDRALGLDVEAAERHYARALALTPKEHPRLPEILARNAEALRQRGRFQEAARVFEESIEGFRGQGDVRRMAMTMGGYAIALYRMGDPRNRAITDEALAVLEPLGPSPGLAAALGEKAAWCVTSGESRQGIAFADRAIALATDLGLPE